MPLNVVLLIDELEVWGGTETHLLRLLPALDPARVRPLIAVVGNCRLADDFRARGIQVEPLSIYRALAPSGLIGLGRIAALLRRQRADLLVAYHTAADLLGPPAARLVGVPALSCRRDEGFTKKPIHVRVQRLVNPALRGMIAVSRAVVAAVEQSEGYPPSRAQVIWNGEDLERFTPGTSPARDELKLPGEALVLCCVGSLTPVKEHETLLRAFAILVDRHPQAHLLIVGDGPLGQQLRALAAELGKDRVHFLGHRRDIPDLLRATDIYVQASSTEGFSNAILQAMACALPVVATAVGGNPELCTSDCGLLVAPRQIGPLGEALLSLAASPELRRELGAAARARVERTGSIAVMVEAYSDAFERAVAGRFPGPSSGEPGTA